jgi:hypothetical protein
MYEYSYYTIKKMIHECHRWHDLYMIDMSKPNRITIITQRVSRSHYQYRQKVIERISTTNIMDDKSNREKKKNYGWEHPNIIFLIKPIYLYDKLINQYIFNHYKITKFYFLIPTKFPNFIFCLYKKKWHVLFPTNFLCI